MKWPEAHDAMQDGRYVRRASWNEAAVIRMFTDNETLKDYFYATSTAKQYFDKQSDGRYMFKKDQHPSDDWEIFPYDYNFDNHSWYYIG